MKNYISFIIALIVGLFVGQLFLAPLLGLSIGSLVAGLAFSFGLIMIAKWLGLFDVDPIGLSKSTAAIVGVGVIAVFVIGIGGFIAGISSLAGGAIPAASVGSPLAVAPTAAVALSSCADQVPEQNRFQAATADVNAYDYAADTPTATNVNLNIRVYRAASVADANAGNFVSEVTDTTAGTANLIQGEVYTFVTDRNATYYAEPLEGFCVKSARPSVNIKAFAVDAAGDLELTGYDSTGSTALAASGRVPSADYTLTMGASESTAVETKVKVNSANGAYWVCGAGTAVGINMTSVKPTGNSASLFTSDVTPEHLKDVAVQMNGTTTVLSRSFSVYKLNSPVKLLEFDSVQHRWEVKSSSSDPNAPTGLDGTERSWFAVAYKDCTYVAGADGLVKLSIHDRTSTEADTGLDEVDASPGGLDNAMLVEVR